MFKGNKKEKSIASLKILRGNLHSGRLHSGRLSLGLPISELAALLPVLKIIEDPLLLGSCLGKKKKNNMGKQYKQTTNKNNNNNNNTLKVNTLGVYTLGVYTLSHRS